MVKVLRSTLLLTVFVLLLTSTNRISKKSFYTQEQWQSVSNEIDLLEKAIQNQDLPEAQMRFTDLRLAYKRIEWVLTYKQSELVQKQLNGAPLPKLEPNAPEIRVLQPKGLQVLEEQLGEENWSQAKKLLKQFNHSWGELSEAYKVWNFTDRMVLEATRDEVLRVGFLHVTGFENPVFTNGILEAKTVMDGILSITESYASESANTELVDTYKAIANSNNQYFETLDFDAFNRIDFIKNVIQPAYALLNELHVEMNIEWRSEVVSFPFAVEENASKIFSSDFLNRYYFMGLTAKEDNAALQELGKTLFFDPILSKDLNLSCASCHKPELGFSDGYPKSLSGNQKDTLQRNAPGLINSVFAEKYFYDLRAQPLETQFEHVIFNQDEFNTSYLSIAERLNSSKDYLKKFEAAFPNREEPLPNKFTITSAIASYVASLQSFNSPVDQYINGIAALGDVEKQGFNLFMGKATCGTCHFAPTFSGLVPPLYQESESEILGVPATADNKALDQDLGRSASVIKQGSEIYNHSFKTTTVRNVELTAPYMHNGVYKTLEEVVDFYNNGGGEGHGYAVPYQTLPPDSLGLDSLEKHALISFMKALTDTTSLTSKAKQLPKFKDKSLNQRKVGGILAD